MLFRLITGSLLTSKLLLPSTTMSGVDGETVLVVFTEVGDALSTCLELVPSGSLISRVTLNRPDPKSVKSKLALGMEKG